MTINTTCSALIRRNESNLKVAQSVVRALSEKYEFDFEEGWNSVCSTSVKKLNLKFRRLRKRQGPYSDLKRPRTAFCIYTQEKRNEVASENSDLAFADLSKKVGELWRGLGDKERKHYKSLEEKDKKRYEKEKAKIDEELAKNPPVQTSTNDIDEEETTSTTKRSTNKSSGKGSSSKSSTSNSKSSTSTTTPTTTTKPSFQVYKKTVLPGLKKKHSKLSSKELNTKMSDTWNGLSDKQKSKYVATQA